MSAELTRKKIAVIVAGGVGVRMGADRLKQFLPLEGRPILVRTVEIFLSSYPDIEIILVLPPAHLEEGRRLLSQLPNDKRIRFVAGGATRFHSVQNGLAQVQGPAIVFVHDAVRCLLTTDLIHRCCTQADQIGSAIPAIHSKDSVRMLEHGQSRSVPRDQVRLIQTPQTFKSEILLPAYQIAYQPVFTDEASVVEAQGGEIHLIAGEDRNIKITSPEDLVMAAHFLAR